MAWTETRPIDNNEYRWLAAALSKIGETAYVGRYAGLIYKTTDLGASTWTPLTGAANPKGGTTPGNWYAAATSANGSFVVMAESPDLDDPSGRIYVSSTGGNSWTEVNPTGVLGDYNWRCVACDATGTKILASEDTNNKVWYYDGAAWHDTTLTGNLIPVAISGDGNYMFAGVYNGRLYRCTTGTGIGWAEVQPAGAVDRNWRSLACSFLGDKVYAGVDDLGTSTQGRIWRSGAYGADATWYGEDAAQPAQPGGLYERWFSLDCSYAGNVVLAACTYWTGHNELGRIYRSVTAGATWAEIQPAGAVDRNWMHAILTHDGNKELACADSAGDCGVGRVHVQDAAGYDTTSDEVFLEILGAGFEFFEESVEKGSPVELYDLTFGTRQYRWTSADTNITWKGNLYTAIPIQRTQIILAPAQELDLLEITMPATNEFPAMFVDIVPSRLASLTITRIHWQDELADTIDGYVVIFRGFVQSVAFSKNNFESRLAVTPISMNLNKPVPLWTYQSLCNHMLFDAGCGLIENERDPADPTKYLYRRDCVVSSASGNILTVTGMEDKDPGWATAGFVQSGEEEFRTVLEHRSGGILDLILPFYYPIDGLPVKVWVGCDHASETCRTKFTNIVNYLGFEFVPTKNPFSARTD
jgi:uncharacterized phage protein (TIGR02218 family)